MAVGDAHVFPGFLTPVLTHLFFPTVSKFKAFVCDNFDMTKIVQLSFDSVENNVGKGENAGYQHFLLFQQCFQKASFPKSLKLGIIR